VIKTHSPSTRPCFSSESLRGVCFLRLVIAGSLDDIAPVKAIEEKRSFWNPEATLYVIDGADHMYLGEIDDLENIINDFIGMNQF